MESVALNRSDPMQFVYAEGNVSVMKTYSRNGWRRTLACALTLALLPAHAESLFIVTEPWVRLAANARSAEAYMELRSTDGATLVGVRSEVTANIVMQLPGTTRAVAAAIALPANTLVKLAPGAYRLTLAVLEARLKLGDRVGLVLTIEALDGSRQEIPVSAEVRRRSPTDDHLHPHKH